MDAFYASVEQLDFPAYRGQPVVVGGDPQGRGVVATCSYEARAFGIHSAMSCKEAYRRCPQAIFVKPRMERYLEISQDIRNIFWEISDLVEPLSLDEAYLDVTENKLGELLPHKVAHHLREQIFKRTGLTASAGVGPNKLIAKIASDIKKPNGLKVVTPSQGFAFLGNLPIAKLWGVGKVRQRKLRNLGFETIGDIQKTSLLKLQNLWGNFGTQLFYMAQGLDERRVVSQRERKSYSVERTFAEDIKDSHILLHHLNSFCQELARDMEEKKRYGRCLTLKVRFDNFKTVTRSKTFPAVVAADSLFENAKALFEASPLSRPVRLLGVGLSQLVQTQKADRRQLLLWDSA